MDVNVQLEWKGNMAFETLVNGHKLMIDVSTEAGGDNMGPRPKPFLLVALGGCMSMDVVSILKKMRVEVEKMSVNVESSQTEEEHPHVYEFFKVIFNFEGAGLEANAEKIKKAVALSYDRYCGVKAMLSKSAPINYEIRINSTLQ